MSCCWFGHGNFHNALKSMGQPNPDKDGDLTPFHRHKNADQVFICVLKNQTKNAKLTHHRHQPSNTITAFLPF
jgi:hypothetical protein